jgi:hypothetical protein
MVAAFGDETWLLAVFGGFPVSYAAGRGIIISSASPIQLSRKEAAREEVLLG